MDHQWTDERIALLRHLWTEGRSFNYIASELGQVSRNAVIGKAHRLGLRGRQVRVCPSPAPRHKPVLASVKRAEKIRRELENTVAIALGQSVKSYGDGPYVGRETPSEFLHRTILDIAANECRWPRGGDDGSPITFCGQPSFPGESYCANCKRIAYRPAVEISMEEREARRLRGMRVYAEQAKRRTEMVCA